MNESTKRILLLVLFIGSVFGIGFALYAIFFAGAPSVPTTPTQPTPEEQAVGSLPTSREAIPGGGVIPTAPGELPQAAPVAAGGVTQTTTLTTGAVQNTSISANGTGMNFYNKQDGKFYAIDKDGNVTKLSNQSFPEVKDVAWNRNAEKAVITFPDQSKVIYDFQLQKQVTIPKHWEDVNFSPTSDQIIAKTNTLDPNNRWLITATDSGANAVPIQALGTNGDKVMVDWSPNDQVVAFADTANIVEDQSATGFDTHVIYPVGKNHENFKSLLIEGFGFQPSWSPNGKTILYSASGSYSNNKPLLWVTGGTSSTMGQNRHSLGLNTWADKCTWSNETTLYCAVPKNLPDNAGLQPSLVADLPDTVYKVDLTNNSASVVAIPDESTTMKNLTVSKDGSNLYYTDASTGQLKLIKLK